MKYINKTFGKISLLVYIFIMYELSHICYFGDWRRHLLMLAGGMIVFFVTFILWFISRSLAKKEGIPEQKSSRLFRVELVVFLTATIYFGGRIIYSAIPYNGALSWKIDEWLREKKVVLEHTNFFIDGVEGVLQDLDKELKLPEELYIANEYRMTFDENGNIKTIYTFLYGKDKKGKTKTYLVDYDAHKSEKMTVWVDGEANADYDEEMRFEPMLRILEEADCEAKVKEWAKVQRNETFEILYYGYRSFETVEAFTVSLHIPSAPEITPVRYFVEPKYVSPEERSKEREKEQAQEAIDSERWTVDRSDGSMYFFLNDSLGWRLVVADAAAGSRFYVMEKTEDGGNTWNRINTDPFGGEIGVTEGLVFFDENLGFAGLTGASQSYSALYVTRDGGATLEKVQLPVESVTELPESAAELGFKATDYDYLFMPEKEGDVLSIKAVTQEGETDGIVFESQDNGMTWQYAGA